MTLENTYIEAEISKISQAMEKSRKAKLSHINVLIVEDQAEMRTLIRDMLAEMGITGVTEAANGEEAMKFISKNYSMINIVICDWNMPVMNGFDFLKQFRAVYPELPFLMLTSRNDITSVVDAMDQGVSAYIHKPFSLEQLEKKIYFFLQPPLS